VEVREIEYYLAGLKLHSFARLLSSREVPEVPEVPQVEVTV
jgi:hypothetical protein